MPRPVKMTTEIERAYVLYGVQVEAEGGGDPRRVWSLWVHFGHTDATVAGGSAFVKAAREQERIANEIYHDETSTPEQLLAKYRGSSGTYGEGV